MASSSTVELREYRLACAATGEYTAHHGGTVAGALAGIVNVINQVNAIYETELAIRLVLVANNDQIIYTDAHNDPYTALVLDANLDENQVTLDSVIGTANYDVGHVLGADATGGKAAVGKVCHDGYKARGVTNKIDPNADSSHVLLVCPRDGASVRLPSHVQQRIGCLRESAFFR